MKRTEKDCSSIELVVTEKGEKGGSLQRVWSRLGEQRREEQTKQRVAEEIGRLEQRRREVQRRQKVAAQSRAERAREPEGQRRAE